jgi:deoxyribodipyrimidine photo-lyase
MKTAIVWFKTDLRLYDNEALVKQSHKAKKYACVLHDADFVTTRYGFKKTGNYRAQFLLESLQDLD